MVDWRVVERMASSIITDPGWLLPPATGEEEGEGAALLLSLLLLLLLGAVADSEEGGGVEEGVLVEVKHVIGMGKKLRRQ
jgi:hypothetical protein